MPTNTHDPERNLAEYIGCFIDACEDAADAVLREHGHDGLPDVTFREEAYDVLADRIETVLFSHGFLRADGLSGPKPTALEQAHLTVASHDIALRAVDAVNGIYPDYGIANDPDIIESMIETIAEKANATVIDWLAPATEQEEDEK